MDISSIGTQAGGFLGGIVNPLFGSNTTTQTTTPTQNNNSTTTIVVIAVAVIAIGIAAYFLLKKQS